jgi:pantetheine-phosphate adenylyltransferase
MSRNAKRHFKKVAMGGTFDILHEGHAALLSRAFEIGDNVTIGVTSDNLIRKLAKEHPVRPYAERVKGLKKYLEEHNWSDRANITVLQDKWGPTVLEPGMEAIVVTGDTRSSADEINSLRNAKGLQPLHVEIVKLILAEDGRPISTTRIHRGEIDPQGRIGKRVRST